MTHDDQNFDLSSALLSTAFVILGAESVGLLNIHQQLHATNNGLDTAGYDSTVEWFADWGSVIQREYERQTNLGYLPDGVFDYEVSTRFGTWAAVQARARNRLPEHEEARDFLMSLIAEVMVK